MSAVDCIVVGAGLSGLTAATEVHKAGLSCLVLEARDRVGGKTWSVDPIGNGNVVDVGAAWINDTNQSEVFALAKDLNLELVVQNTTGRVIQEDIDGSLSTFEYGGAPEALSEPEGLSEMLRIRQLFEDTCQRVDIRRLKETENELDQITLQQWIESSSKSKTALASASVWTRAMLGLEPSEVSALHFLNYCKSGGGLLQMRKDTEDGGQYLRFVKGTQSLSQGLASRLPNNILNLNTAVTEIAQSSPTNTTTNRITVRTSSNLSNTYTTKHLILTLPTPLYTSIGFTPQLPAAKISLSHSTIQGYTNKVLLLYSSPWWRTASPTLCGLLQSFKGPITVTRDSSVDQVGQYSLTCFLVGSFGRNLSREPQKDRFNTVVEHVNRVFGPFCGEQVEQPIAITEYEWVNDEWSRGCPVPCMPPGVMTSCGQELREPFGTVHFAGTETAWEWKGYMDGAVRSGKRAAAEVIEALKGL